MRATLDRDTVAAVVDRLGHGPRAPAAAPERQPLHTVYGGAHLFREGTARRLGELALAAFADVAPDAAALADAFELPVELAERVHPRVRAKLEREPVEDLRIDFEDGFGPRPSAEEDAEAIRCATELGRAHAHAELPPGIGIRIKSLAPETHERAIRTLDLAVTAVVQACHGHLPPGFVVTLPKVTSEEQVAALADLCDALERGTNLAHGALRVELMVESAPALVDEEGRLALPGLVRAARGRCRGVHLGAYDLTASLGIAAAHQTLDHPACVLARQLMQLSLGPFGVALSDGATNVLPVPVHRGADLSPDQVAENRARIRAAHRVHARNVEAALAAGIDQGWDLHPAQIVSRLVAVFAFHHRGLEAASARLRAFLERAARASLLGDVFDDAATGQGLLAFFLRGLAAGALTEAEVMSATGLGHEELRSRSFPRILAARSGRGQLPR